MKRLYMQGMEASNLGGYNIERGDSAMIDLICSDLLKYLAFSPSGVGDATDRH
jgi:hypothetical protein